MQSNSPQRDKAKKLNDMGHVQTVHTSAIPTDKFKQTPVQLETRNNPQLMLQLLATNSLSRDDMTCTLLGPTLHNSKEFALEVTSLANLWTELEMQYTVCGYRQTIDYVFEQKFGLAFEGNITCPATSYPGSSRNKPGRGWHQQRFYKRAYSHHG